MKALILSGGTGSRLRPLTFATAKQLIPVAGKPTLFYLIEKVVRAGITDIGMVVGHTQQDIRASVGTGEKWGARITYIHQPQPLGLAHAVKTASGFIGESPFLMLLGDNLFQMELQGFVRKFLVSGSDASILLHSMKDPSGFGVAVVEDGHIKKLVEKPNEYISSLIITGVYLFTPQIFTAIDRITPSFRGELEITDALQKLVEMGGNVTYSLTKGWWKDTGRLEDVLEANRLILNDLVIPEEAHPAEGSVFTGRVRLGENVRIENSVIEGPVVIGSHSRIIDSRLGPCTSIDDHVTIIGCNLENSILLEGVSLENLDKPISGSLIGKNATIRSKGKDVAHCSFLVGSMDLIHM